MSIIKLSPKILSDALSTVDSENEQLWSAHRVLAKFNHGRLNPKKPTGNWREIIRNEERMLMLEGEVLEWERLQIRDMAKSAPKDERSFLTWFEALMDVGPGQYDPLFDWLAESASVDEMRWFIKQEVAGEAGFDDLTALTQVKLPTRPKLEVARNYWDEMGRGNERMMHGPMLAKLAEELGLGVAPLEEIVPESLALGNILLGLAMNRRFTFHSVGALGAVELTAPWRAKKVYEGLKRLGISNEAQRYYLLHSTLDVKHSATWNAEVIAPLVAEDPSIAVCIAEGALMRLNAGRRCFKRYRQELWSKH